MNRQIKFRVWDIKNNRFCKVWCPGEVDITCDLSSHFEGEYIFQQYTGLIDKNGKEIYEGDILQYSFDFEDKKRIGEVMWISRRDEYDISGWMAYDDGVDLLPFGTSECRSEVIGNIFENKELL
jgi:uncharacterized phage protein (TIGR01671 family)